VIQGEGENAPSSASAVDHQLSGTQMVSRRGKKKKKNSKRVKKTPPIEDDDV
jgi:hypothetical protein